jgi:hypothetical protein
MGAAAGFAQQTQSRRTITPSGIYRARRPQASPLYRLIEDHFDEFCTVYDERFARRWGYWRKVVRDCRVQSAECSIVVATRFVCSIALQSAIRTHPHRSLANWHPHLHLLVTDGGFRPDGTFVHLPLHDVTTLTEAFRRAVLRMFVKRELIDIETAQGVLAWPHSGFHMHDGVWAAAEDKKFTVRLARYRARNPIALSRMEYHAGQSAATYHSDKPSGPTAGSETTDALEFLAWLTSHIPDKNQVLQRYYGFYSARHRAERRKANGDGLEQPLEIVEPDPEAVREAKRRWANLLRRILEVEPLTCPHCVTDCIWYS